MMRIEAIRDRTNERNQTRQAKSTRAVGSNAGSFGKSSRWRHLRNSYSIPWRLCPREGDLGLEGIPRRRPAPQRVTSHVSSHNEWKTHD